MSARPVLGHIRPGSRWTCSDCARRISNVATKRPRRLSMPPPSHIRSITQNHIRKIMIADEEWQYRQEQIEKGEKKSMLAFLEERGYVNQVVGTKDDLDKLLTRKRVGVYVGVDPTAPSLHVGHMVPFMALGWMYIHGYSATFLMGGFTAGVGDPIGRLTGRQAQSGTTRIANSTAMHQQLKKLGTSMERYAEKRGYAREWAWRRTLVNNYQWWQKATVKDLMKVLGSGTRIGPMLGRDTVKNRLESGEGMSFSEFSYPLLQAWDWWQLYKTGTSIQIGGGDQFGNILAGADAVKYLANNDPEWVAEMGRTGIGHLAPNKDQPHSRELSRFEEDVESRNSQVNDTPMGFTVPLLTTSSGEKFGKSAGNAVWLEPSMTSSFDLYQFWLRTADADVEKYLKLFTFIPTTQIEQIMEEQRKDQSKRVAQHALAKDFVDLVHGEKAAEEAEKQHRNIFAGKLTMNDILQSQKTSQSIQRTADGRPMDMNPQVDKHAAPLDMHTGGDVNIKLPKSLVIQQPLSRILWSAGLVASRSEGQRLINNKGAYVGGRGGKGGNLAMTELLNYVPIDDAKWSNIEKFILDENILILRTGKWRVKVVTIVPDEEYRELGLSCPGWDVNTENSTDEDLASSTETAATVKNGEQGSTNHQKLDQLDLYGEELYRQSQYDKNEKKKKFAKRQERNEELRFDRDVRGL